MHLIFSCLITLTIFTHIPMLATQAPKAKPAQQTLSSVDKGSCIIAMTNDFAAYLAQKPADKQTMLLYNRLQAQKTDNYIVIMAWFEKHLNIIPDAHLLATLHAKTMALMHAHLAKTYGSDFDTEKPVNYCAWLTGLFKCGKNKKS